MYLRLLAAASLAVACSFAAHASTISYTVYDGTTLIGSGSSVDGTLINGTGNDSNYTVSLNAEGPAKLAPNFSSDSFNVVVSSLATPSTLTINITDVGLTSGPTVVANTFTTNSLASSGDFTGDTISNYFDQSNAAFGMGTLLATTSFSGSGGFAGPFLASIDPSGMYSETTVYTMNFAASTTSDTTSASSQIVAATPEPSSLMLLGTGALSMAYFVRRRVG